MDNAIEADEQGLDAFVLGHFQGSGLFVNCVAVTLKCAEVTVKLRAVSGLEPRRGPSFALAPPESVAEFRAFVAGGRNARAPE